MVMRDSQLGFRNHLEKSIALRDRNEFESAHDGSYEVL
jgi:hypothetical protein